MNPGPWGILIIAVVVLLLFGRGKIASLMGEVAGGIKAFRKGMADEEKPVAEIDQTKDDNVTMTEAKEAERSKDA